jgi:hypothetical protein
MLCDCVRYVSEKSEKVDDTYVREIYRFDIVRPYEKFFELLRKSPFCREITTRHAGSKILEDPQGISHCDGVSHGQTVNPLVGTLPNVGEIDWGGKRREAYNFTVTDL